MPEDDSVTSSTPDTALWRLLEAYHAVVYFAPERESQYRSLGLKGGWMAYFASRSAPLGATPPEVVTACFYNFKHTMVARALPDAWTYTSPAEVQAARLRVAHAALRRLLGPEVLADGLGEAAELAVEAARTCSLPGRPLGAAYLATPEPDAPHLRLFWAATVLREFRGDGHNVALAHAAVDGCEAHVIMRALGLVPVDQRAYRGWSEQDWADAVRRLRARGWLTDSGRLTVAGEQARASVESMTDILAAAPLLGLGAERTGRLVELLTPLAARIVTGGGLGYPNAIGVPPVPELSPRR